MHNAHGLRLTPIINHNGSVNHNSPNDLELRKQDLIDRVAGGCLLADYFRVPHSIPPGQLCEILKSDHDFSSKFDFAMAMQARLIRDSIVKISNSDYMENKEKRVRIEARRNWLMNYEQQKSSALANVANPDSKTAATIQILTNFDNIASIPDYDSNSVKNADE